MDEFIPKELSWLSFNGRVLQEACDPSVPLIERVRFLGIYSNNQDEFFKVRVADLKRQSIINKNLGKGAEAVSLLKAVQKTANDYQEIQNQVYRTLLKDLAKNRIYLKDEHEITSDQRLWVQSYFKRHVLKHINPVIITEQIDLISFLKDEYTYLVVKMSGAKKDQDSYALIEIPSDVIPRFIRMPSDEGETTLMFLDDVIRTGLDEIFKGLFEYVHIEAYSIKMNRDAEYDLLDSVDKSILENMSEALKQRLNAMPVRFAYDANMPSSMVEFMVSKLKMSQIDSLMPGSRYHNFKDFLSFPSVGSDDMENPNMPLVPSAAFDLAKTPFEAVSKGDVLLYYPYYSFEYFTEFLRQSSYDPKVQSIKINIYRVASNSRVIDSLIVAANNGKRVTVVVELKARFDEANNIHWASRLTDAGVQVLFGLPTLKIHSKLCLITRREGSKFVRYAYIGTGNFNEKTAKTYTDFALFTKHEEVAREVESVFDFIEYPYAMPTFRHLLVSPLNARRRITAMIDREIQSAGAGFPSYIILKANNLVDPDLIRKLYEASQSGVKIRAIIRGMCSLRPGIAGLSENIIITSIVDRLLEHPRVMIFCNNNEPELYITSADWMPRNLDYRIEVGAQILDPALKKRISDLIDIQCRDNQKARIIDADQKNEYVPVRKGTEKLRSQTAIHSYLDKLETALLMKEEAARGRAGGKKTAKKKVPKTKKGLKKAKA